MTFPETPVQEDPKPYVRPLSKIALNPLQIELILAATGPRRDICRLCYWINEDVKKNASLTKHGVAEWDGTALFPAKSKARHLKLERILPLGAPSDGEK